MMWEQWRAEIDGAVREAELARDHRSDLASRSEELEHARASILSRFRPFGRARAKTAVGREEILPPSWRLREAWVRRPVL